MYLCARDIVPADGASGKPGDARAAAAASPPAPPFLPSVQLRLLYEVGPMAYLIEKAGGASSDGRQSILDLEITSTEQRTQVRACSNSACPESTACVYKLLDTANGHEQPHTYYPGEASVTSGAETKSASLGGAGWLLPGCVGLQARSAEVCRRRRLRTAEEDITRHAHAGQRFWVRILHELQLPLKLLRYCRIDVDNQLNSNNCEPFTY